MAGRPDDHDTAWAVLGYLGAALVSFALPLAIYLLVRRQSPFVRAHTAQAVNVAATAVMYAVSEVIAGGILALASVTLALRALIAGIVLLWLATAIYLSKAAVAAGNRRFYPVPRWLNATFARASR